MHSQLFSKILQIKAKKRNQQNSQKVIQQANLTQSDKKQKYQYLKELLSNVQITKCTEARDARTTQPGTRNDRLKSQPQLSCQPGNEGAPLRSAPNPLPPDSKVPNTEEQPVGNNSSGDGGKLDAVPGDRSISFCKLQRSSSVQQQHRCPGAKLWTSENSHIYLKNLLSRNQQQLQCKLLLYKKSNLQASGPKQQSAGQNRASAFHSSNQFSQNIHQCFLEQQQIRKQKKLQLQLQIAGKKSADQQTG